MTRTRPFRQYRGQSAASRGYGAAWQRMRTIVLSEEPLCRACRSQPSTDVDHIIPVAHRPDLRLARSNLQGLCGSCHRAKTVRDSNGEPRRRPAEPHPGEVRR